MPAEFKKTSVIRSEKITESIVRMTVEFQGNVLPGQFFMLRTNSSYPLLSRPVSVNNFKNSILTFLFEVKGEGTKLLSEAREVFLLGPLGTPFPLEKMSGSVAVVSGGIGIAPLEYLIKSAPHGAKIDLYAGFREKSFRLSKLKPYVNEIFVSTDSGAEGYKGFITDLISVKKYDVIFACGPEIMMKKLAEECVKTGTPGFFSLERHMACGVGACYGCAREVEGKMKCVCKDGPVFSAKEAF